MAEGAVKNSRLVDSDGVVEAGGIIAAVLLRDTGTVQEGEGAVKPVKRCTSAATATLSTLAGKNGTAAGQLARC